MLDRIANIIVELKAVTKEAKSLARKEILYKDELKKIKLENVALRGQNATIIKERDQAIKERDQAFNNLPLKDNPDNRKVKELLFANKIVCQQRDQALQELSIKREELLKSLQEAKIAKKDRDISLSNLDEVISKLEAYQNICQEVKSKISQGKRVDADLLIEYAERLLFEEELGSTSERKLDYLENSYMFTDQASINRSLLDR
ncbi:hypothetical protein NIES4102_32760 [Chondrocystis sp. NIES-4102]|nr:hypothetical protein NIES4102_32760 [Chondrocystis sp. NIES-4102]